MHVVSGLALQIELRDLLYNVRIYFALPTIADYIAIPSAENYIAFPSTGSCFMSLLFVSSMVLNVSPFKFDLIIYFINLI